MSGTVRASIRLEPAQVEEIRSRTASGEAYRPEFNVRIFDEAGETVAEVHKALYVRRKAEAA